VPSSIRLEQLTPENIEVACRLRIRPDQESFVEPVARSIAEAYVHPELAWPRLVVDGEEVVAFVMAFLPLRFRDDDPPGRLRSGIWRLNVAADSQGEGYGTFAVHAVCDELRRREQSTATVTWAEGPGGPAGFYLGLGFRLTGERSGDQVVAELDLRAPVQSA
jgi:diamine N-acetyltransferase